MPLDPSLVPPKIAASGAPYVPPQTQFALIVLLSRVISRGITLADALPLPGRSVGTYYANQSAFSLLVWRAKDAADVVWQPHRKRHAQRQQQHACAYGTF